MTQGTAAAIAGDRAAGHHHGALGVRGLGRGICSGIRGLGHGQITCVRVLGSGRIALAVRAMNGHGRAAAGCLAQTPPGRQARNAAAVTLGNAWHAQRGCGQARSGVI